MDIASLLRELYGRILPLAEGAVDGVAFDRLTEAPQEGANPIAWLVWHMGRIQDHHVAELLGAPQLWVTGDWASRFGLAADPDDNGYGHTPAQVRSVRPVDAEVLCGYLAAVLERTDAMLASLSATDLDRVVDTRWDPPVTMGVGLVCVADDALQHAGQAAYVKGLLGY
jgi:hypothetical protein